MHYLTVPSWQPRLIHVTSSLWQVRSKHTTIAAQLTCGYLPCRHNSASTCTEPVAWQEIKPHLQCLKRGIPSTGISSSNLFSFLPCQQLYISWQIFPATGCISPSNGLTQEPISQWFRFLFVRNRAFTVFPNSLNWNLSNRTRPWNFSVIDSMCMKDNKV